MKAKTAVFLCAFAALALAPLAARADLIYWMVNDPAFSASTDKPGQLVDFSYATISVDGGASYLTAYNQGGPVAGSDALVRGEGSAYFGSFDRNSVDSFLVELWLEDEMGNPERVGWQSYKASGLAASIWNGDTPGGSGVAALAVTEVVPEPSSGLMLLFGGALLALRRRRAAC